MTPLATMVGGSVQSRGASLDSPRTHIPRDLRRVLVLMTDRHMGNLVVSLPVIQTLLSYFDHPPDVMVDERFAPLLALLPALGKVLPYPHQARKRRSPIASVRPALMLGQVWLRRYEAVIDIGGGRRSAILSRATCARRRVGFLESPFSRLYTQRISRPRSAHALDKYATILRAVGTRDIRPPRVRLRAPADATAALQRLLDAKQPDRAAPLAVLHPGAGQEYREWPADRFAAVADQLVRHHGMNICIIGGPSDRALADSVMASMREKDSAFFLSLPLLQLLALFERASLMVSNESGPTHLASITELPIVTIFGPGNENIWRPVRKQHTVVLRGAKCDPRCGRRACYADRQCLMSLSPQTVYSAADELLRAGGALRSPDPREITRHRAAALEAGSSKAARR